MIVSSVWLGTLVILLCPAQALWWGVDKRFVMDPRIICRRLQKLGRQKLELHKLERQYDMCRDDRPLVREIVNGVGLSLAECQTQMTNELWNCSTHPRSLRNVLKWDTRETAMLQAISAAGVTHAVTKACRRGSLTNCGCSRHNPLGNMTSDGTWEWSGCHDDLGYGLDKSQEFMDRNNGRDIRTLLHLHNNRAGRVITQRLGHRRCKCHGLSGSCTLKTCWFNVARFSTIASHIKQEYGDPVSVVGSNDGDSLMPTERRHYGKTDLLFIEPHVDYCVVNKRYGSLGTHHRKCSLTSREGNCEHICCGRSHVTKSIRVREEKCQFRWCCEVICEEREVDKNVTHCL